MYSYEEKLKLVKLYLDHEKIYPDVKLTSQARHNLMKNVRTWTKIYLTKGAYALKPKQKHKKWSKEIKLESVKRILDGESIRSVATSLGMFDTKSLRTWVKMYSQLGAQSIESSLRGMHQMKKTRYVADNKLKDENVKLKKQLEYLKAENEYLKKVQALVQKKKDQQTKKNS